ncbi:MAG: metal ABC transporter substrate-binding protein [Proteobacteria bacterium]|nr:metal ABC transporter substrate-binding protein [Pseudomonadota bacterium]MBU1741809.1 metal ABC transporter substrate-binding protein [Pseudomonadota bacterium]
MTFFRINSLAGMALLSLILVCGPPPAGGGPARLEVAVTIHPVADLTRSLAGVRAEVLTILPPGASPHTFAPTPRLLRRLAGARLLVMIGAGADDWATKLVGRRTAKVVLTRGVRLLPADGHGRAEPGHGNPHVWLDPVLMKTAVGRIARALVKLDPAGRSYYLARRDRLLVRLSALDTWIRSRVKTWRHREYVAFHPFLAYLAVRYGLKRVGVIERSPGKRPTPRHLAEIVRAIRRHKVRFVLAEPQVTDKAARVIAREAGVKVIKVDPLGGPGTTYGRTYFDLLRHNVGRLERALK